MKETEVENSSYPIGKFSFNANTAESEINQWVSEIEKLPFRLKNAVMGLNESQLNTSYRDGGWTIKQVVHHLADSHMNAFIRIKLAITENHPTIKPYEEKLWAEMDDAKNLPIEISLSLLEPLHIRLTHMLKKLSAQDFNKTVFHPESKRDMSVKFLISLYSWHGRHHCAHITTLRERMKW